MARTVAFHSLGCKVNSYESEVMARSFLAQGFEIVPFHGIADVYVVNTCSVTNIADRKSRQMLHQARRRNPDAVVVAVGCYVETDTEKVRADEKVDLAVGNVDKTRVAEHVVEFLRGTDEKPKDALAHDAVNGPRQAHS
ncbi:MAG: tRNA (N(6)-L-threonylcarbamoyladenosine(37)-C(2))-methylthiotransferase MtaB, partial [Lachnospiraceae bacterium]|nr:tRNA (N(6)-L-threonylcarbamoyladenosine(37)-C(2))-methylthiotransferase MtaB [Lachnospiraceae bacterium]